jgi:hypothetical protein
MSTAEGSRETLELRPTRRQHFLHHLRGLAFGVSFVALGVFAGLAGDGPVILVGWIAAGVGGLGLLRIVPNLIGPPNAYMRLSEDGFEAVRRSERAFVPWAAVKRFYLTTMGHGAFAPEVLMFAWNEEHPIAPDLVKSRNALDVLMRKAGVSDRVVFLPPGFTSEELLPILTKWHKRGLGMRD